MGGSYAPLPSLAETQCREASRESSELVKQTEMLGMMEQAVFEDEYARRYGKAMQYKDKTIHEADMMVASGTDRECFWYCSARRGKLPKFDQRKFNDQVQWVRDLKAYWRGDRCPQIAESSGGPTPSSSSEPSWKTPAQTAESLKRATVKRMEPVPTDMTPKPAKLKTKRSFPKEDTCDVAEWDIGTINKQKKFLLEMTKKEMKATKKVTIMLNISKNFCWFTAMLYLTMRNDGALRSTVNGHVYQPSSMSDIGDMAEEWAREYTEDSNGLIDYLTVEKILSKTTYMDQMGKSFGINMYVHYGDSVKSYFIHSNNVDFHLAQWSGKQGLTHIAPVVNMTSAEMDELADGAYKKMPYLVRRVSTDPFEGQKVSPNHYIKLEDFLSTMYKDVTPTEDPVVGCVVEAYTKESTVDLTDQSEPCTSGEVNDMLYPDKAIQIAKDGIKRAIRSTCNPSKSPEFVTVKEDETVYVFDTDLSKGISCRKMNLKGAYKVKESENAAHFAFAMMYAGIAAVSAAFNPVVALTASIQFVSKLADIEKSTYLIKRRELDIAYNPEDVERPFHFRAREGHERTGLTFVEYEIIDVVGNLGISDTVVVIDNLVTECLFNNTLQSRFTALVNHLQSNYKMDLKLSHALTVNLQQRIKDTLKLVNRFPTNLGPQDQPRSMLREFITSGALLGVVGSLSSEFVTTLVSDASKNAVSSSTVGIVSTCLALLAPMA